MNGAAVVLCCLSSLFLVTAPVVADPPPLSPVSNVHEVSTNIETQEKATMYTVTFAHLPLYVTGDDFDVHIIGNRVLKVIVGGTNYDWFFKLAEPIPDDITLKPPIETERLEGDFTGAVWKVSVLVPKNYYAAAPAPPQGTSAGEAGGRGTPATPEQPLAFAPPTFGSSITSQAHELFGGAAAPASRARRRPVPDRRAPELYPPPMFDG
ncbi:hypothetical protein BESB_037430 [Besnoitia besnoiti]|uniref:Uncharacterized protein n=1 Tax=Besnoitia besnoiti TaxID=94643 RepID=A0A2A9MH41_BESBE|nr:hypothetical protein BESB_037430 [Besnoitia besnoiti]PFH37285.1 hypothetical protein BESB_037430 [Besnoitia besnoiti]